MNQPRRIFGSLPLNTPALVLLLGSAVLLLLLPRRFAIIPLIVATCYVTRAQNIELVTVGLTVLRLLLLVGLMRVVVRRELPSGGLISLDILVIAWGSWMIVSSLVHAHPTTQLVSNLGRIGDAWGVYFLTRIFCSGLKDVSSTAFAVVIILTPIAGAMLVEKQLSQNVFAAFGGVPDVPHIREGKVRAQGPFAHAILAGTVGAVSLPFVLGLWKRHTRLAVVGILASLVIVYASTSSGPILSTAAGIFATVLYFWRQHIARLRWLALAAYIVLDLVMKDPAYFLVARIDLTGGSTGWHRARLIQSSIEHLGEWWLAGTDYTRHWMASGVSWSPDHADITNHYIYLGVIGGLPLVILFVSTLIKGFQYLGHIIEHRHLHGQDTFFAWALGATLFTHTMTCLSVAYFDQSAMFLYLTLGLIGSSRFSLARADAPITSALSPVGARAGLRPRTLRYQPITHAPMPRSVINRPSK